MGVQWTLTLLVSLMLVGCSTATPQREGNQGFPFSTPTPTTTARYQGTELAQYRDRAFGWTILYPSEWHPLWRESFDDMSGSSRLFLLRDSPVPRLQIVVHRLSGSSVGGACEGGYQGPTPIYPEYRITSFRATTLASWDAVESVYDKGTGNMKGIELCVVVNRVKYVLKGEAIPREWPKARGLLTHGVYSFRPGPRD
jgi:hypothetical protein